MPRVYIPKTYPAIRAEIHLLSWFNNYAERWRKEFQEVVDRIARKVAVRARRKAPRLTGALRASIYASTSTGSDYAQAKRKARRLRRRVTIRREVVPDLANIEAVVSSAVWYAWRVENIGPWKKPPPKPFLNPAVTEMEPQFVKECMEVIDSKNVRVPFILKRVI
jgi:hypothetical protein